MNWPVLTPPVLFLYIVLLGVLAVGIVFVPVQLASKIRRIRRSRYRMVCRICGYRFLRQDAEAVCPHCHARNR